MGLKKKGKFQRMHGLCLTLNWLMSTDLLSLDCASCHSSFFLSSCGIILEMSIKKRSAWAERIFPPASNRRLDGSFEHEQLSFPQHVTLQRSIWFS